MQLTESQQDLAAVQYKELYNKVVGRYKRTTWLSIEQIHDCFVSSILKSAAKYDETTGFKFSTYFSKVMDNAIRIEMRDMKSNVRKANYQTNSLDAAFAGSTDNNESLKALDLLKVYDNYLVVESDSVETLLTCLDEREKGIIIKTFFTNMLQKDIAKEYNIAQPHVSRIKEKAIIKMQRKAKLMGV